MRRIIVSKSVAPGKFRFFEVPRKRLERVRVSLLSRLPYGGFLFQLRRRLSAAKLIPSVTHDMGIGMEYSEQPEAL
jgi:hypothetical protein